MPKTFIFCKINVEVLITPTFIIEPKKEAYRMLEEGKIGLTEKIKPLSILKLDSNIQRAIEKMEFLEKIYKKLPGIDCGSCGAPTCHAMAEDVVRGKASIDDCVIKQRKKISGSRG